MSRKRLRMEQMNHQQPIVASSSHHQPFAVPGMSGSLRQWENNRTGQQEEEQSEELSEEEEEEEFHDVYAGKVYGEHGEGGEEEEEAVEEEEEEEEESEEADFSKFSRKNRLGMLTSFLGSLEDDEDLEGSDIVSWVSVLPDCARKSANGNSTDIILVFNNGARILYRSPRGVHRRSV